MVMGCMPDNTLYSNLVTDFDPNFKAVQTPTLKGLNKLLRLVYKDK